MLALRDIIEQFAHAHGELSGGEWFLDEAGAASEHAGMQDRVVGIAGHIEDFELFALGAQPLGEFAATHLRKHQIGEQELDSGAMPLDHFQSPSPLAASSTW